jgi:hypothetical protein
LATAEMDKHFDRGGFGHLDRNQARLMAQHSQFAPPGYQQGW